MVSDRKRTVPLWSICVFEDSFVEGKGVFFRMVFVGDAVAFVEQPSGRTAAAAGREPYTFPALGIGYGRSRIQVGCEHIPVFRCFQRREGIPGFYMTEAVFRFIYVFPAFIESSLIVNADAEQGVRHTDLAPALMEAVRVMPDADIAGIRRAQQTQPASPLRRSLIAGHNGRIIMQGCRAFPIQLPDKSRQFFDFCLVAFVHVMADIHIEGIAQAPDV